eukprot:TRINITY_DN82831_c0_g1_i1.p1 TRINITY_DN82831_c0_g1~~TRINITY_DN82831_c0_g1_i1.p1  ORF type:complete len:614 (-),score=116.72 TRINITY_DN82831_c0_g1_i1:5-1846(-)
MSEGYDSGVSCSLIPVTLKWGKQTFSGLHLKPGLSADAFKREVYAQTGVPAERQKLMCKGAWQGALKDGVRIDDSLALGPKQSELTVLLIGTADASPAPPTEQTKFVEDLSPEEVAAAAAAAAAEALAGAEGMIVALQKPPGERDDKKQEVYKYNACVTGMPQQRIEKMLRSRREGGTDRSMLLGECAMTLGLEMGRAYVNVLSVLQDGTLVSGMDDGHVQLWRHGVRVRDSFHEFPPALQLAGIPAPEGGVTCIAPLSAAAGHDLAFATGGNACVKLWTADGRCSRTLMIPVGVTPNALSVMLSNPSSDTFLAATFRQIRSSDAAAFHLVPQNEAERQRRHQAEAQEAAARERLARAVRSVQVWSPKVDISSDAQDPSPGGGHSEMLEPSVGVTTAPLTSIAVVLGGGGQAATRMVCGDKAGGLHLWKHESSSSSEEARWSRCGLLQLRPESSEVASVVCMVPLIESGTQLLAVSTETVYTLTSASAYHSQSAITLGMPLARAVVLVDISRSALLAVLNAHSDTVQCMCALPGGGLATGGGKHDASVRVWDPSLWQQAANAAEAATTAVSQDAIKLKEPGYVFALEVLPDTKPGSQLFALAAARYNVVKICL